MLKFLVGDCSTVQLSYSKKSSYNNHMYHVAVQIDDRETRAWCPSALMFSLKLVAFLSG